MVESRPKERSVEPLTVTRRSTLPADRREVWRHLADADLLGAWLGAEVAVEVGARRRRARSRPTTAAVDRSSSPTSRHEAGLGFVWWDEDDPAGVSAVELRLDEDATDTAVLTVTETLDPAASLVGALGGRACDVHEAGAGIAERWGLRLGLLAADLSRPSSSEHGRRPADRSADRRFPHRLRCRRAAARLARVPALLGSPGRLPARRRRPTRCSPRSPIPPADGSSKRSASTDGLTATDAAADLPVSRQAVVKHLQALADAGLVAAERHGREQRYRITPGPLTGAMAWMADVGAAWDERLARLRRRLEH